MKGLLTCDTLLTASSDWPHQIAASQFSRDRSALVFDMEYWGVAYLRPFQSHEPAKTGDSVKYQLLAEYALAAKQQAASVVIADLATRPPHLNCNL
jgi:hypothetical protein